VVHVGPRTDEEIKQLVDQAPSATATADPPRCHASPLYCEERMLAWLQLRALAFAFVVYSCTAWGHMEP